MVSPKISSRLPPRISDRNSPDPVSTLPRPCPSEILGLHDWVVLGADIDCGYMCGATSCTSAFPQWRVGPPPDMTPFGYGPCQRAVRLSDCRWEYRRSRAVACGVHGVGSRVLGPVSQDSSYTYIKRVSSRCYCHLSLKHNTPTVTPVSNIPPSLHYITIHNARQGRTRGSLRAPALQRKNALVGEHVRRRRGQARRRDQRH